MKYDKEMKYLVKSGFRVRGTAPSSARAAWQDHREIISVACV